MIYDPHSYVPTLGKDVSGLALWLVLIVGLSFAGGATPTGAGPVPSAVASCPAGAAVVRAGVHGIDAHRVVL